MKSEVKIFEREDGQIQRVQVVSWEDWSTIDFLWLKQDSVALQAKALECFSDIYQNYLVPVMPWIFPQMVMFALPAEEEIYALLRKCAKVPSGAGETLFYTSKRYGNVSDLLTIASIVLQEGVKIKKGKPAFKDADMEAFYRALESRGCVRIVQGKLPQTKIIPVGRFAGYLSEVEPEAKLKVNAHFFIMDAFDCATIYDQIGTPFGLCMKNGVVETPPMYARESLLVKKDGTSDIRELDVTDLHIEINGQTYVSGENASIYTRPDRSKVRARKGKLLAIVGRRVAAVKSDGWMPIPASGFVMEVSSEAEIEPGDKVIYRGLEDVLFGVQAGNSIIRKGVKTEHFISRFYDIYKLQRVPFPPSLYPMDFEKARAARIALGVDQDGRPVLFWAEGKGKICYKPGEDSTGASLSEMAEIAEELGLRDVVNLDGGGSAQILLDNVRTLHISDRNKEDNSDAERLVPLALIVR